MSGNPEILTIQSYSMGDVIYEEGRTGPFAYIVQSGRVQLHRGTRPGQRQCIGSAGPGMTFGEIALIGGRPHTATAIAVEPSTCIAIPKDRLDAAVSASDPFVAALFRILVSNMLSMIENGATLDCLLEDVETIAEM